MGFRGIERITGIHHTTIMNWVRESGEKLPEDESGKPEFAELDELQTYIGRKIDKIWVWTAINHLKPGILAIEIGDRSGQTFNKLWQRIKLWNSRRYFTDGYCVYANYVNSQKHQVLPKTQLTRVEGENTRLRHCARGAHRHCEAMSNRHTSIARLHRATLCYSKSISMLKHSVRLLMHYLKFEQVPIFA